MSTFGEPVLVFRLTPLPVATFAFVLGVLLRIPGLPYRTTDAVEYLQPWYAFALQHGWGGIGEAFTNYAPLYGYLLILAAKLDGLAEPLTLVKGISFVAEFGCAFVAAALVRRLHPDPVRAAFAFAAVWLAPSVLQNGSFWGQADAIWTLFLLLSLLALVSERPGLAAIAFGAAVSVKAQALFLAPLGLGLVLAGRIRPVWMLAVPGVYALLALPTVMMGRSVRDVATVYLQQSGTFPALHMNAANLYVFTDPAWYSAGVPLGLAVAAACGLAFAWRLGRSGPLSPDGTLLAAAFCLLLMPFVLPKMHERFFYAFEIVILVLAVARPNLLAAAVAAQFSAFLSYLPTFGLGTIGLPLAVLLNLSLLLFLGGRVRRLLAGQPGVFDDSDGFRRACVVLLVAYLGQVATIGLVLDGPEARAIWPANVSDYRGLAVYASIVAMLVLVLRPRTAVPRLA